MRLVSPSLSPSVVCTLEETPWLLFYQTRGKWGNENNSALQESTSHLICTFSLGHLYISRHDTSSVQYQADR